jgi:hypothetical protein
MLITSTTSRIIINVDSSDTIDAFADYSCPGSIHATASDSAKITNLCATVQMSVTAEDNAKVYIKSSTVCPQTVNLYIEDYAEIRSLCATDQMSVTAEDYAKVYVNSSTACPQTVNIDVEDNALINGLCATGSVTVSATDYATVSMIRSSSAFVCPSIANVHADDYTTIRVCATQSINIIASNSANVYYYGPVNSSQLSSGATATAW